MAAPFELKFSVDLQDALGSLRALRDGMGQVGEAVGNAASTARSYTDGLNAYGEVAGTVAQSIASLAVAAGASVSAQEAEAAEVARLTELLGSEEKARASLNSQIIDMTATQVASEEEMAASLERRNAILAEVREREAERVAAQQDAAASTTSSAAEEVAAAEAVHNAQQVGISDATQAALLKAAAAEASSNLAIQIQDLAQAQRNLAEIEAAEPANIALIIRAQQELAAETQRVAEAERVAAQAKLASAEASERLAAATKREAESKGSGSFSGKAQELGQLLTTLGLVDAPLLRLGVGFQMVGQAAASFVPKIAEAGGGVGGLMAVLAPIAGTLLPIVAAVAAVDVAFRALGAAAGFVKDAISAAIPEQAVETDFAILLGNTQAARERLEELDATAQKFNLPTETVRAASEELTRFSQGALGSGKSLEMVIEAAARTGQSMTSVASMFGRAYESIQAGQPIQRVTQQLERAKIISASTANELKNLAAEGKSGTEVWAALEAAMSQYSGAAAAKANTFAGETQGIRTAWQQLLEVFGRPIVDALTPILHNVSDALVALRPVAAMAGQFFGSFAQIAVQSLGVVTAFVNGDWRTAIASLGNLVAAQGPVVGAAARVVGNLVLTAFFAVQTAFDGLGNAVVQTLATLFDKSLDVAAAFVKNITQVLNLIPGNVKATVDGAVDAVVNGAKGVIDGAAKVSNDQMQADAGNTAKAVLGVVKAYSDLAKAKAAAQAPAPNDGTEFKKLEPGATVLPDAKAGRGGSGRDGVSGRDQELAAAKEAEREYRDELAATKDSLELGEISVAQAQAKNTETITASIAKFKALQQGLAPTSQAYLNLEAAIKKAQLALSQQSVFGQVQSKLIQLKNEFSDLGKQLSELTANQINGAIDGIAQSLGQLVTGTNNVRQAFQSYVQSTVTGLAKIMEQQITAGALSSLLKKKDTADTIQNNAQKSASNTTAGLLDSLASWGISAAVGAAAFLAAMALTGGFQSGGYTGHGAADEVAGVVHRGEYVFPQSAVSHWGVNMLSAMSQMRMPVRVPDLSSVTSAGSSASTAASGNMNSYSPTGRASRPLGSRANNRPVIHIHSHPDENAMKKFISGNEGEHIVVNHVQRNAYSLGIPTA